MAIGPLSHLHSLPVCLNLELVYQLIQAEGNSPKTSNWSNRQTLICYDRVAMARKDRQAGREAVGSAGG